MNDPVDFEQSDPTPAEVEAAIARIEASGEGARMVRKLEHARLQIHGSVLISGIEVTGVREITVRRECISFIRKGEKVGVVAGRLDWRFTVSPCPAALIEINGPQTKRLDGDEVSGDIILHGFTSLGSEITADFVGVGELERVNLDRLEFR